LVANSDPGLASLAEICARLGVSYRFPAQVLRAELDHAKPTSSECAISSSRLKSHLEANRRRPKDDGAHLFLDRGVRPRPIGAL